MFHIVRLTNVQNSTTVSTKHNLNRSSCRAVAILKIATFSLKTLLYANNLPFPPLPNWNRNREELILYWRVCYPDVSHDLKVYTFPPYPAADI